MLFPFGEIAVLLLDSLPSFPFLLVINEKLANSRKRVLITVGWENKKLRRQSAINASKGGSITDANRAFLAKHSSSSGPVLF